MKKIKPIPQFKTEDEERKFWATHDFTDYFDWSKAEEVKFVNLKRTNESVSLSLSRQLLAQVKKLAQKRKVPLESLIETFLSKQVQQEVKLSR